MSVSIVVGLTLAGCTGSEPDPPQTFATYISTATPVAAPAATATSQSTASPIPAPTRPPEMDRADEAGAMAAVKYFLDLQVYMMATGDTAEWDRVAWDQCRACAALRSDVEAVYPNGGHFAPSDLTLTRVESGSRSPTLGGYPVEVDYSIAWGARFGSDGTKVRRSKEESGTLVVDVLLQPSGWMLMEISDGAVQ